MDSQPQSSSRTSRINCSLFSFRQISPVVQTHLLKVYFLLCCAIIASVFGASFHILLNIGGFLTFLATFGCIYYLVTTPPHAKIKRVSLLMTVSFLHGASIGPLIELAIELDPGIVVCAFISTAIVFACFSGAALLARRRVFLYLGGFLSSGLSMLLWIVFASVIFDDNATIFIVQLYFGLLLFVGYIVVDTQVIIERAHLGHLDYVTDALLLSTDFISVFVRILIIILKSAEEEEEKKKKEKKKRKDYRLVC